MAEHSKACCTLPPVISSGYQAQGKYEKIAGFNAYVTGNRSATRGVLFIYDIFGFSSQSLQGADRLAESLNGLVIIPDLLKGEPADANDFPPNTPEKKQRMQKFMTEKATSPDNFKLLVATTMELKQKYSDVESWGIFGLCWGGKLAVLLSVSEPGALFKASGQAHPARLAKEDAKKIAIPHICLVSPDEPADIVKEYEEVFKGEGKVGEIETYPTMFHGWMGARANFENKENLKEYERGYNQVSAFFAKYL
jgi:dienelactone hydrolase